MLNTLQRTVNSGINTARQLKSEIFDLDDIVIVAFVLLVAVFIQVFFPPGTRTISRRTWMENFNYFLKHSIFGFMASTIPSKYLREYRCPNCNKLLAKGRLSHKDDALEVKCRGCSAVHMFKGEDADIIEKRSELLKEGLIPDPETN